MRRLVTGLEAIARGAHEEGVHLLVVNPRRPLDLLAAASDREGGAKVERAATGRLAFEIALGASVAGGRALAAVASVASAADLLAAASNAGLPGLVVVAVDDPGLALAPGESDARVFARAAKVPCLEPSDAAGCRVAVGEAFALSERWGTPVVVRLTTRLALSGGPIALRERRASPPSGRRRAFGEQVLLPGHARALRSRVDERLGQLAAHGVDSALNVVELRSAELGVIASGIAARHARDALPEASLLTLGLSWPVPTELVRDFAGRVRRLVVAEELEPLLEAELRSDGIPCEGKDLLPRRGELLPDVIGRALGVRPSPRAASLEVPERPSEACAGCPHRPVLHALKRLHVAAIADLGCAAFGGRAPLGGVEVALGPNGAVALAHGVGAVLGDRARGRVVALVGEGGLAAGAAPLAHALAAGPGAAVVAVEAAGGGAAALAAALGAHTRSVDAFDLAATEEAIAEALAADGPSVVVARGRCARGAPPARPFRVEAARCNRCGACLRLGCPAIADGPDAMTIDPQVCAGCGVCGQVCRPRAIEGGSLP